MKFSRLGPVRYLGHLDMMRYFQKAVMRAGLPAKYSEGFHPHQLMSFAYPLGVAMETLGDYVDLELTEGAEAAWTTAQLIDGINAVMHEGIRVVSATYLPEGATKAMAAVAAADYLLTVGAGETAAGSVDMAKAAGHGGAVEDATDAQALDAARYGQTAMGTTDAQALDETAIEGMLERGVEALLARQEILIGGDASGEGSGKSGKKKSEKDIRAGIYELQAKGCQLKMQLSSGSKLNVRPADVYDVLIQELPGSEAAMLTLQGITRLEIYGRDESGMLWPLESL